MKSSQLNPISIVSGRAYKGDHCQGKSQKGAKITALRNTPNKARGPHQYAITTPNAVGKYHNEAPGSVLNQIESHVPRFAIKNGRTHVHHGSDGNLASLSFASAGFET